MSDSNVHRTPRSQARSQRVRQTPYDQPASTPEESSTSVRRSSSMFSFPKLSFRNFLSSFTTGSAASTLPLTNNDLRSESGSDEEWDGEPPATDIEASSRTLAQAALDDLNETSRSRAGPSRLGRSASTAQLTSTVGGSSKRQQAKMRLKEQSDRFDTSKPDFGLTSPTSPMVPGSFRASQIADDPALTSTSSGPPPSSSRPAKRSSLSPSNAYHALAGTVQRLVSPTRSILANTPSNKRSFAEIAPPSARPRDLQVSHRRANSLVPAAQMTPASEKPRSEGGNASAARIALDAIFQRGTPLQMTPQDLHLVEGLSRAAAEEAELEAGSAFGTPQRPEMWAANLTEGTPRLIKPLRAGASISTPGSLFDPDGSAVVPASPAFSVGQNTPGRSAYGGTPKDRKVYCGPGMSARKTYSRSNLRPSTPFRPNKNDAEDDVQTKKRRMGSPPRPGSSHETEIDSIPPVPPLPSKTNQDAVARGKASASNIMVELLDAQNIVPIQPVRKTIIVNQYDTSAPPPSGAGATGTPMRSATPSRSALRKSQSIANAEGTPSRGAAALLQHTPGTRQLTTVELLEGKTPWELSDSDNKGKDKGKGKERAVRLDSPARQTDEMEIEELIETPSKTVGRGGQGSDLYSESRQRALPTRPAPEQNTEGSIVSVNATSNTKAPTVAPVKSTPLPAPQMSSLPSFPASPRPSSETSNSTYDFSAASSIFPGQSDSKVASSAPKFSPAPMAKPPAPDADADRPAFSFTTSKPAGSQALTSAKTAKYLSAKQLALQVDKVALPFFTFQTPSTITAIKPSAHVARAVMAMSVPTFVFTATVSEPVPKPATSAPSNVATTGGFNWAAAGGSAPKSSGWTCDLCMTPNNPADADKCAACETLRPGSGSGSDSKSKASAPAPAFTTTSGGFNWAAAGGSAPKSSGWTCDLCMTPNNPADAVKCQACETARPGSGPGSNNKGPVSVSFPAATNTTPSSGFNWAAAGGSAPKSTGWTCDLCMTPNNPADATKCQACETPKP